MTGNMSPIADERGSTVAEFALLLPPFLLLVLGIMHLCLLMFASSQLHVATEYTARCRVTSDTSTATSYKISGYTPPCSTDLIAKQKFYAIYRGPTAQPTVTIDTPANPACGLRVQATTTYNINAAFFKRAVPLSATACFAQ
jgi:Flp pilus assembly protein TadG